MKRDCGCWFCTFVIIDIQSIHAVTFAKFPTCRILIYSNTAAIQITTPACCMLPSFSCMLQLTRYWLTVSNLALIPLTIESGFRSNVFRTVTMQWLCTMAFSYDVWPSELRMQTDHFFDVCHLTSVIRPLARIDPSLTDPCGQVDSESVNVMKTEIQYISKHVPLHRKTTQTIHGWDAEITR